MADKYKNFNELLQYEVRGRDFDIITASVGAPILMLAPHGGKIEPGTTELARAAAGEKWGFYSFRGLKDSGNRDLHITSTRFDEPVALAMAASSICIITFHGSGDRCPAVYTGGLEDGLKRRIELALAGAGFCVTTVSQFLAVSRDNICNKNAAGRGVQLEITAGLRQMMFYGFPYPERKTPVFDRFIQALRLAVDGWWRN